jgi:hypothetical protein
LYLVGVSFKLVRMASVKQFLVELMLFTVGMDGGGVNADKTKYMVMSWDWNAGRGSQCEYR